MCGWYRWRQKRDEETLVRFIGRGRRGCEAETDGQQMNLVPVTLTQAQQFVGLNHRHNAAPQGHRFSIGLQEDGELIGVAIVGRPIARLLDDGWTAEITRVCVLPGRKNANSMLYGASVRAAKAMGYRKVIIYTLPEESGSSLRAAGFRQDGVTTMHKTGWSTPARHRDNNGYPIGQKIRWVHD